MGFDRIAEAELGVWFTTIVLLAGVATAYPRLFARLVRRHVERIEASVVYDPVLGLCAGGQPMMLASPDNDTTVVFFDGFRVRPAVSMHRHWLERLHVEHRVNVLAPVLGHQSMCFASRDRSWSHQEECRAAVQMIDSYRMGRSPGHRIVVVAFSFGALSAYSLAALQRADFTVLISPLPHRLDLQIDQMARNRGLAGRALRGVVRQAAAGRGRGLVTRLLPYYVRPGISGGWDIADRELRARFDQEFLNGQELRIFDVYEVLGSIDHVRRNLIPRIVDQDMTVVWGERDTMLPSVVFEDLARALTDQGNRVSTLAVPDSAHNVLHDVGAGHAIAAIEDAIRHVRARETEPIELVT